MYLSHTHTDEGIQFRNISVSKICDFLKFTAVTYNKVGIYIYIYAGRIKLGRIKSAWFLQNNIFFTTLVIEAFDMIFFTQTTGTKYKVICP